MVNPVTIATTIRITGKNVQRNTDETTMSKVLFSRRFPGQLKGSGAKAQVRDVPHDVERHTVVEIIAHIGHTEEMYQMVLAVINQRNDDLSVF